MTKHTGLMILAAGAGIQAIDYVTRQPATVGGVSPGGFFYGPGGVLASYPKTGLFLLAIGAAIWVWKR